MEEIQLQKAVAAIRNSNYNIAFTGAGISVESGIPPFRGESGIWSKYDPNTLELGFFHKNPVESWEVIKQLFYDFFGNAKSNLAHQVLAEMEIKGMLECVITQNIDNLHQQAGSKMVFEFHGNSQKLLCVNCRTYYVPQDINLNKLPPKCIKCDGLIKPDFIFFGEGIPPEAYEGSVDAASKAEVVVIVGSTGEVMPAAQIPYQAKQNGATIIEINPGISNFTKSITDIYLEGKATEVMGKLKEVLFDD